MDKKTYTPQPIDTSNVTLPPQLIELAEALAKNVHEVWAQGRIAQGWSYGETRDDAKMHHPCLIEYDELPESEKDYDRATALSTLKLITILGYDIVKRNPQQC